MKLIDFAPIHFAVLAGWFTSERDIVQWAGPQAVFPLDDKQLRAMLRDGQTEPPTRRCWMAEDCGEIIGHAQLGFDWRNGNAMLSRVAIAPSARRRRLAAPMVRLIIEKAFAMAEVERLELNVYTFNAAAIRTYERLGFVLEGVRRSSVCVGHERWDTAMMGLLRADWKRH
jgi:RimJ/RimL family protein N-acetyltransferase